MNAKKSFVAVVIFVSLLGSNSIIHAAVKLPAIFGDHMVLQQKSSVAVWGWADPGEKVTVKGSWQWFLGKSVKADKDGVWKVYLKTPKAGRTVSLKVKGSDNEIVLKDVLVGEVWICSGQSNMQSTMARFKTDRSKTDIEKADSPGIRLFTVKSVFSTTPKEDVEGTWETCTPKSVVNFSAVGYYFGKNLQEELNVPIGLISTNWGGTKAEAWTSRETIQQFGQFDETMGLLANPAKRSADFKIHPNQPTVLYNAMIAPLTPMRIAGAIWYQGESNCYDPILYRTLFPGMIEDWRNQWNQGDFPFYFVQIAPFQYSPDTNSQAIREAQMMTLDATTNVGMAVTMDIAEEKDIHPRNKHDVGDRLARWALAKTYGKEKIVYSGPLYKSMKVESDKIRLSFSYTDGGLVAKDSQLADFLIAGKDKKFIPAKAVIDGKTIVISCDTVKEPIAVRYGWSNWVNGSLFNKAGLPASSFRTDDWPLK